MPMFWFAIQFTALGGLLSIWPALLWGGAVVELLDKATEELCVAEEDPELEIEGAVVGRAVVAVLLVPPLIPDPKMVAILEEGKVWPLIGAVLEAAVEVRWYVMLMQSGWMVSGPIP